MEHAIAQVLREHGLRATPQRIQIYDYLIRYRSHPDADEVYQAIMKSGQHITLATVYNVLQAFVEKNLAITVKLDEQRTRFDADTSLHGHFVCSSCGRIYDFPVCTLETGDLDGFEVKTRDVYYSGICRICNEEN